MFTAIVATTVRKFPGHALVLLSFYFMLGAGTPASVQYVSPLPDSKHVSAETNIIIRVLGTLDHALAKDSMLVFAYGSKSGRHAGRVAISDDDETIVFTPQTPFTPGELVSVRLSSAVVTREGFTVAPLLFTFRISPLTPDERQRLRSAVEARSTQEDILTGDRSADPPALSKAAATTGSLPDGFPSIRIAASNNPSPGTFFLGSIKILRSGSHFQFIQFAPSDKQYVMIVENNGSVVYYRRTPGLNTDFKVQPNGHLTYYDDDVSAFRELDTNYVPVAMYAAGNGYRTDVHAFRMLPSGHVIFLCQEYQTVDMSTVVPGGKPDATVIGMVIQELDKEKNVVFQWRTFDHFKITDATHEDLTEGIIDYVHSNTIEMDVDGNILLSSRHMDEITKIDRNTGNILWRWGGKHNEFTFVNDSLRFSHQHSIRRTYTGTYILFDNGNFRTPEFSRVAEYALDQTKKTATLVWQYRHTPDIFSVAMASVQRLTNGNTVIGWGTASPAVTEVHPDGTTALELQLPDSVVSYRAFKSVWPMPSTPAVVTKQRTEPLSFSLRPNYPNPFNPTTTIEYDLKESAFVTLTVYDLLGRTVAALVGEEKPAGKYSIPFNASAYSSGTYLAVLRVTQQNENGENVRMYTRKMVLNK